MMIRNQMKSNNNSKRKKNLFSLNPKKIITIKLFNPQKTIILLLTSKMILEHSKTQERIKHQQDV